MQFLSLNYAGHFELFAFVVNHEIILQRVDKKML